MQWCLALFLGPFLNCLLHTASDKTAAKKDLGTRLVVSALSRLQYLLLTLSAHVQRGLQYLVCVSVTNDTNLLSSG